MVTRFRNGESHTGLLGEEVAWGIHAGQALINTHERFAIQSG
jgi:hypothetical protein